MEKFISAWALGRKKSFLRICNHSRMFWIPLWITCPSEGSINWETYLKNIAPGLHCRWSTWQQQVQSCVKASTPVQVVRGSRVLPGKSESLKHCAAVHRVCVTSHDRQVGMEHQWKPHQTSVLKITEDARERITAKKNQLELLKAFEQNSS